MNIEDWLLEKIELGEQPEEIARQMAKQRLTTAQWESLIQKAKQAGPDPEIKPYLMTLFHAARLEDEWLSMRILGIVAQSHAFEERERLNAMSSMEKRLERMEKQQQDNPDADSETQLSEYQAYLLVLKGSLRLENGETAQAKAFFRQARQQYAELNNQSFVGWLDAQIKKMSDAALPGTSLPVRQNVPARPFQPKTETQPAPPVPGENAGQGKTDNIENDAYQRLRLDYEKLQLEMNGLRKENAALKVDLEKLEEELQQPDVRDRDEEVDYHQALEDKDGEIDELQEKLRKKDQQVIDLQRDLQNKYDQIGQLKRQLQQKQDEIEKLENELEELSDTSQTRGK